VKFQLTCASFYLAAYELLIYSIVIKTKDFYTRDLSNGKLGLSKDYKKKVKALFPQDIVVASSLWLYELNAITEAEVEKIKEYKNHRNDIAYELPKIISDSEYDVKIKYFKEVRDLYKKIQLWWILEVELPTNDSLGSIDFEKIDTDELVSLIMIPMDYLLNIVSEEIKKREDKL